MDSSLGRELLAREVERHVLALREYLVRFDENLKAHQLMQSVPYWAQDLPAIAKARADQYEMVKHILDPAYYETYYANNPHERPFEEQYNLTVEDAHLAIPRLGWLRERLAAQEQTLGRAPMVLDLSMNDGWMPANLGLDGYTVDGIDLNPLCVERAKARDSAKGQYACGDLHDAPAFFRPGTYDAVVCFETIEHVRDPASTLSVMETMAAPGGVLYVSTPDGAVEGGDLPDWDFVESKGHVRAMTQNDVTALIEAQPGLSVDFCSVGPDKVIVVAAVKNGEQ